MRSQVVLCWAMVIGALLGLQPMVARGQDPPGKAVFESMHCQTCHKTDRSGFAPSLKAVASGYDGDVQQLTAYFKGQSEARIDPPKAAKMDRQLEKVQKRSAQEIDQLAHYIASFK